MKHLHKFFPAFIVLLLGLFSVANVQADEDYQLDTGDRISMHVFEEDMDVEVQLGASGTFRFPYLGTLSAKGKTVEQLENEISNKLRDGYLINPQVRVRIEEFRPFYVNGEVKSPGGYPFQQGLSVRKALSLAGGFSADADEDKVFVIRENGHKKQLVSMGSAIHPGDIVMVERSFFFINGEVASPGKYSYKSAMSFRMAVSLAGGFTERASESSVEVQHHEDTLKRSNRVKLDDVVQAGDVITVKQSFF